MRTSLLLLALISMVFATVVNVTWTYEGKPIKFLIDDKPSYSLKLCVENEGTVEVIAEGIGKVSAFEAPGCVKVKVYFDEKEGGNVDGLKAYALYVNFRSQGVEIERLGYLRILKIFNEPTDLVSQLKSLGKEAERAFNEILEKNKGKEPKEVNQELLRKLVSCFKIEADEAVAYPGSEVSFKFVNSCGAPLNATIKLDVASFEDLVLKTVTVSNETVTTVKVPKAYSVGPIFLRGVYVQVLGKDLYYLPVYDFFKFYIAKNLYAVYYKGGASVSEVNKGEKVTGCVYVPQLVPTESVPALEGSLRAKKDLAFRPDQVIKEKVVYVSKLPFQECIEFEAQGDWFLRGYKLELVAHGEKLIPVLPLEPVAVAKGELKVK
ncbi:hypothetical protein EYM_00920 [Ignicoccus islandicus DSM 13165]|uniref:Uncharacterized protein n=1 Tax=Ignicoccus islandicus DSM 13165 TaxID=940295 RepID=A0A0U3G1F9_9CREN|nr:hypothetical protein [Ignicoccus islandicus]ALU12156.1 hypothetical protein EYM_00920 [Ignicoccus islandicus DSM 13165]